MAMRLTTRQVEGLRLMLDGHDHPTAPTTITAGLMAFRCRQIARDCQNSSYVLCSRFQFQ